MAVAVFDYTAWITYYPEFSAVASVASLAPQCFAEASLYVSNTDNSPITDLNVRLMILGMMTAHIFFMKFGDNKSQGASPLVGRISNATEGSVTVGTTYADVKTGSRAWFDQTKYGASAWQALAPFRTFRYIAPACPSPFPGQQYWPR